MSSSIEDRMSPELRDLARRVGRAADAEGVAAYLVGGVVRDLFLGATELDLDITVEGDGIAFAHRLAERLGGEVKSHQRFGTAVVVIYRPAGVPGGSGSRRADSTKVPVKVDVTTARRESYPRPGALPRVQGGSLREDLLRRDFTINSMAARINSRAFGELVDPFGGRRDLAGKVVRVLHDGSFRDDPTRLYRAIRFEQRLGFRIEEETARLLKEAVASRCVDTVSGERIRAELLLLLGEQDPCPALRRLRTFSLLEAIHPGLRPGERDIAACADAGKGISPEEATRAGGRRQLRQERLLALMSGVSRPVAEAIMARLSLRGTFQRWMRELLAAREEVLPRLAGAEALRPSEIHRLLSRFDISPLRVLAVAADSEVASARIVAYLEHLRVVQPRLGGRDLVRMGLRPGPQYRRILGELLAARLDGEVRSRADEIRLVKSLVKSGEPELS